MRSTIASDLRSPRWTAALTVLAFATASPGRAAAQSSPLELAAPPGQTSTADRTLAEALFREGRKLIGEGKVSEACRKFEASYQIDRTGGTVLNLALCHESEGRTASAWTEFQEALALATAAKRRDREKIAAEHLAAVEKRLSHVIIDASAASDIPGLAVTLDGSTVRKEGWGIPIPVDPGKRIAGATAPGRLPWEQEITIEEAKSTTVTVPLLKEKPKSPPPSSSSSPPPPPPSSPPPPPSPPSRPAWMQPVGFVAIGLGVVGVGLGTYLGISALSHGSTAETNCPDDACNEAGWEAVNDGRSVAMAANVSLGAGVLLAAAGVVLVVVGGKPVEPSKPSNPSKPAKDARPRVAPSLRVGASGAALGVEGTW